MLMPRYDFLGEAVASWLVRSTPDRAVRGVPLRTPFVHLGGEWHCEIQVPCPRTQRNGLGTGEFNVGGNPEMD